MTNISQKGTILKISASKIICTDAVSYTKDLSTIFRRKMALCTSYKCLRSNKTKYPMNTKQILPSFHRHRQSP